MFLYAKLLTGKFPGIVCTTARCDEDKSTDLNTLPDMAEVEKPELVKQAEAATKAEEKIKPPGQFELIHMEAKSKTSAVENWDGARMEMNKPITPTFAISHMFWLGSSDIPGHAHYTYGATVAEDSDRLLIGRMSLNGMLEGRLHYAWTKQLNSKFITMIGGPQDVLTADLCYDGESCNVQGKVTTGPSNSLSVTYMQALTPRLAMGGEGLMDFTSKMTALSGIVRYGTPDYVGMATLIQGGQALVFHYVRNVVKDRAALGAELMVQPSTLGSTVVLGAEFKLKQSKINSTIDGDGRIATVVETTISPGMRISFSGEMTHGTDKYKFGYGLSIG